MSFARSNCAIPPFCSRSPSSPILLLILIPTAKTYLYSLRHIYFGYMKYKAAKTARHFIIKQIRKIAAAVCRLYFQAKPKNAFERDGYEQECMEMVEEEEDEEEEGRALEHCENGTFDWGQKRSTNRAAILLVWSLFSRQAISDTVPRITWNHTFSYRKMFISCLCMLIYTHSCVCILVIDHYCRPSAEP